MSSALITIVGKMKSSDGTESDVTISGLASIIGLYPASPPPRPHPQPPLGTWGPGDPMPTPPIPVYPGGTPNPPVIWGGPIDPYPDIGFPAPQPPGDHQPVFEKKVAWTPEAGWVVVWIPTGEHVTPSK